MEKKPVLWNIPGELLARIEAERKRVGIPRTSILATLIAEALDARERMRSGPEARP